MLASTRTWTRRRSLIGASAALLCAGMLGCNSSSKSHAQRSGATAGVTSGTTGGVTSTTTGGVASGTTGGVTSNTTGGGPPAGVTDDHANSSTGATPLTLSATRAGLIQYAGDADWFSISLSAGVDYTFMTQNLTAGADTILRLMDVNGSAQLAENDDVIAGDPSSRLSHTPAANGTYFLVVLHKAPAAAAGGYTLRGLLTAAAPGVPVPDDHKNDATTTSILTAGAALAGTIENAGDEDWFKMTLAAGSFTFTTRNLAAGMDTVLSLIDTNGTTVITTNDDYGVGLASQITRPITVAGTYYLSVRHFSGSATGGTYELIATSGSAPGQTDDHRNDATTTSVLTLGQATSGRVETAGDLDWFRVTLAAGTTYTLRTTVTGTDDTVLTLFSAAGVNLAENDDEGNGLLSSRISFPCTASGVYYLQVKGYSSTTPSYTVSAGP